VQNVRVLDSLERRTLHAPAGSDIYHFRRFTPPSSSSTEAFLLDLEGRERLLSMVLILNVVDQWKTRGFLVGRIVMLFLGYSIKNK